MAHFFGIFHAISFGLNVSTRVSLKETNFMKRKFVKNSQFITKWGFLMSFTFS